MGYQKFHYISLPASGWTIHGDDFAWHPQNKGEEFRWNTKVLYYACDQSFLDYFGANGVAAVDAAVAVFNSLPNASDADLNAFPLEASRINYTASALHLYDLKSTVMELLIERALLQPHWSPVLQAWQRQGQARRPARHALASRADQQLAVELRPDATQHRPVHPPTPRPTRPRNHHDHHHQAHQMGRPLEPRNLTYRRAL